MQTSVIELKMSLLPAHYQSFYLLVAHHEDFEFFDVVDKELPEAGGQHVLGLLVATITDVWHQHLALESPTDPVVNTSGLPPVLLHGLTNKNKTNDNTTRVYISSAPPHITHKTTLKIEQSRLTAILT